MKNVELTQEEKEKLVDELNAEAVKEEVEGNTSLFNLYNMAELGPYLKELTPMEMFEKSVALNYTSAAMLDKILPKLSKKNLIRLFFATLKLPENNAVVKFGGKQQEKQLCEMAYAHSQLARNALVHVLGTTAIAQARMYKKKKEEEAQANKQEEQNEQI